jgi:hypothetical protein
MVKAERQGNNYKVDWTSKQEKGYMTLANTEVNGWDIGLFQGRSDELDAFHMALGGKVKILPGDKYVVTGLHVKALLDFEFPELYRERNGVTLLHLLSELGEAS